MASHIGRRKFLATLGGAATWPLAARAQQTERMRRIGVLMGVADDAETKGWLVSFHKRLEQLGWRAATICKSRSVGRRAIPSETGASQSNY
jgi:putative ABC transport system substrate-binding protein